MEKPQQKMMVALNREVVRSGSIGECILEELSGIDDALGKHFETERVVKDGAKVLG